MIKPAVKFLFLFLLILPACTEENKNSGLPYLGHHDIVYSTVDGVQIADTVYAKIPEFSYLNQDSVMVHSPKIIGKVWIADFFFSTCPTICPIMTTQMKRLNSMTKDLENEIQFMSFSINPDYDKPSILRKYIKHHGIEADNWYFFTGDEEKTHALGVDNFLVHAESSEEAPGGFAHSPAFVLVDREGYVRGVYVGTDTKQVDQLEKDVRKLLAIEYGVE